KGHVLHFDHEPPFGPTGQLVYDRTYSRTKADGSKETWEDTVNRVVDGNINLVDPRHIEPNEADDLKRLMYDMKVLPAGRHLWASGATGRPYLCSCFVSGAEDGPPIPHFAFTFMRLMEAGGVVGNSGSRCLSPFPTVLKRLSVEIVCNPTHA